MHLFDLLLKIASATTLEELFCDQFSRKYLPEPELENSQTAYRLFYLFIYNIVLTCKKNSNIHNRLTWITGNCSNQHSMLGSSTVQWFANYNRTFSSSAHTWLPNEKWLETFTHNFIHLFILRISVSWLMILFWRVFSIAHHMKTL